LKTKIPFDD